MNKIAVNLLLLMAGFPCMLAAQDSTSPEEKARRIIADKFPSARFLNFEYEHLSPTNYSSEIYGENYEKGKLNGTDRFKLDINFPLFKTNKFAITPHIVYKYESMDISHVENNSINYPVVYHKKKEDFHTLSTTMNAAYYSKLFGKPFIFSLNLSVEGSEKGYEYMSGTVIGLLVLKRNARTKMSVALISHYTSTSILPIFPLFSYEYKFPSSQWSFDCFLPKYVYFRRMVSTNGRLTLGTNLSSYRYYAYPEYQGLNSTYDITRKELKTGFIYEHHINKYFILSVRGGFVNPIGWKVTEKSESKAIINYSPNMSAYFNIGFSCNPF